jgi:hypothetical protein
MDTEETTISDQKNGFLFSLRGRITGQMLLISLLPLIVLGFIFWISLSRAVDDFGMTIAKSGRRNH